MNFLADNAGNRTSSERDCTCNNNTRNGNSNDRQRDIDRCSSESTRNRPLQCTSRKAFTSRQCRKSANNSTDYSSNQPVS